MDRTVSFPNDFFFELKIFKKIFFFLKSAHLNASLFTDREKLDSLCGKLRQLVLVHKP